MKKDKKTFKQSNKAAYHGDTQWRNWIILATIMFVAFLLRVSFARRAAMIPFNLLSDSSQYTAWAKKIIQGEEFIKVFHQSPLYPYFLAGIFSLFGYSLLSPLIIQAIIGAATCLLIYYLALDIFKNEWTGILSASILAIYGPAIFYSGMLLMATLLTFLYIVLLILLKKAIEKNKKWLWIASGIILGLSAIGRGTILLFIPVLLLFLIIKTIREYRTQRMVTSFKKIDFFKERFFIPLILFIPAVFLPILPATLHNYSKGKDFVLIAANAGITFYEGNNPWAAGVYMDPPGLDLSEDFNGGKIARFFEKRDLRPSEISGFWSKRAWEFIEGNPLSFLRLYLKKITYFWNNYEIPNAENYYFAQQYSDVLKLPLIPFFLIGTLGLLGIVLAYIKKEGEKSLLLLFLLTYMLYTSLFFITARYRLPIIPILIIFTSYSITELYNRIKRRNWDTILFYVILGIVFGIFVVYPWKGLDSKADYASSYVNIGVLFHYTGNPQKALQYYQMAVNYDPTFIKAYNNLGGAYYALGQREEAFKQWERGLKEDPMASMIHFNLGNIYLKEGQVQKARDEFAIAAPQMPYSFKMQEIKEKLGALR